MMHACIDVGTVLVHNSGGYLHANKGMISQSMAPNPLLLQLLLTNACLKALLWGRTMDSLGQVHHSWRSFAGSGMFLLERKHKRQPHVSHSTWMKGAHYCSLSDLPANLNHTRNRTPHGWNPSRARGRQSSSRLLTVLHAPP